MNDKTLAQPSRKFGHLTQYCDIFLCLQENIMREKFHDIKNFEETCEKTSGTLKIL